MANTGLEICRTIGIERTHGVFVDANAAEAEWRMGQWDEALDRMLAANRRRPTGYWVYFNAAPFQVERGELDVAAATFGDGLLPDGAATLQNLMEIRTGQASLAIWQGHPELVRPIIDETIARVPMGVFASSVGPLLWRASWAEAELAQAARARRDDAGVLEATAAGRRALDALDAALEGYQHVLLARYRPLLEAEQARLEDASSIEAWRRAASPATGPTAVYERAYATYRLAEALAAEGDRAGAAAALGDARTVADRLGAVPLLGAIDDLARRAGIEASGTDGGGDGNGPGGSPMGLTDRERQVLTLVAEGRSNREIAEALFISPKTASVHVSNILAKVGAKSRGEAAAIARRAGLVDTG